MNKLAIPFSNEDPAEIFECCVTGYTNAAKVNRLLRYKDKVASSSKNYLKHIPWDIEHYPEITISSNDSKMLVSVYEDKFSKSTFKAGRAYYDIILAGANGKCAICNIGVASTLDHYLPKSEFPTLCVFPANLVPECQSCNKNKRDYIQRKSEKMLLHPYFDDLSTVVWLDAKLSFASTISVKYYNSYTLNKVLASRINITLEKYSLLPLFALQANSDISNNLSLWKQQLQAAGADFLRMFFSMCRKSRESEDLNSWASALYRGLERQSDEVVDWLTNNP